MRRGALALFAALAVPNAALGVRPMSLSQDLVAGSGNAGFADGSFTSAEFSAPVGLAPSRDGRTLYVADRDNNRIRAIRLSEGNRVTTVAGSGARGRADGRAAAASFDRPAGLVEVEDGKILVNDDGNALFRLVDPKAGTVETVAGNGARGLGEGAARDVPLGGVWSLAAHAGRRAVFFTQPGEGAIRRLDLATWKITTVLLREPSVPEPAALCVAGDTLYVAGRTQPAVFRLALGGARSAPRPAGRVRKEVLALAAAGAVVYALQADQASPVVRLTGGGRVDPSSILGGPVARSGEVLGLFFGIRLGESAGFAADPVDEGLLYVSGTEIPRVLGLRDLQADRFGNPDVWSVGGLRDYAYPFKKPPGTFRILVLSDSRGPWIEAPRIVKDASSRADSFPKRLDLLLNTRAALAEGPLRYQVLMKAWEEGHQLLFWPVRDGPELASRFDIDLVLLFVTSSAVSSFGAYFERPLGADGLPQYEDDPEFLLKPFSERVPAGDAVEFVRRAREAGTAVPLSPTQMSFPDRSALLSDAGTRGVLLRLLARPLEKAARNLEALKSPRGRAPVFALCYAPIPRERRNGPFRPFFRDLCERSRIPFVDLTDPMLALEAAYAPVSDSTHYTSAGHALVAASLLHELVRLKLVPF